MYSNLLKDRLKLIINLIISIIIDIIVVIFYYLIVFPNNIFVDHFIIITFFVMFVSLTLLITKQLFNVNNDIMLIKLSNESNIEKIKRIRLEKLKNIL